MITNAPIPNINPPHKKLKTNAMDVAKIQIRNSKILPNNPKKINAPMSNINRSMFSILVVDDFREARLQLIAKVSQDFIN